ncbi:hypothetical protein GCK32_011636, partial [Trichostrongylus colubriformis]
RDDADMMDPPVFGIEEIEEDLLPSASSLHRQVLVELVSSRYIRTEHDTTMKHLAEFIHLLVMEEVQSNQCDFDADPGPTITVLSFFMCLLSCTFSMESGAIVEYSTIIFFDMEPPQIREQKPIVLGDVVHAHF